MWLLLFTKKEYNLECISIPETQKYWFVRTQDGKFFDEFIAGRFISIGWNKVSTEIIKESSNRDHLHEYIKENFPKEKRHGLTATHMIRFVKDMTIGDIVVIPSKSSARFAFGRIISEVYEESSFEPDKCDFVKRRKIDWISNVDASDVDANLRSIKYAETAISSADAYANYIDRQIGEGFYIKGNVANLVLTAGEDNNIKVKDLNDFLSAIIALSETGCPDLDINDIEIKLNLQSRGKMQIIGSAGLIFLLATGLFIATKDDFDVKVNILGCSIEGNAHGKTLLQSYSDYKDQELDREFKRLKLEQEKLKIESIKEKPEENISEHDKISQ